MTRKPERPLPPEPTTKRERLREVLLGVPVSGELPERGSEEYRTQPHCGNLGCACPTYSEVDRIIEALG